MILAVTGHRPNKLGGYGAAATSRLNDFAEDVLSAMMPEKVITGMALGWDQAMARAALARDVPFVAAVPFEGQENAWPADSRRDYLDLLEKANEIVYVSPPGYVSWKMQARNEWMVDRCEALLALWNGTSGGTANCVRYAEKKEVKVFNVWDEWKLMKWEEKV